MTLNENESINKIHIGENIKIIAEKNQPSNVGSQKLKVYKRRWLMLVLYTISTMGSMFQWQQYGIIANIIARYYGVSPLLVELMASLESIFYVLFTFPNLYFTNKYGLRWIVVGSGLSWLGAFMKAFSVHPDRFYLIIISKSITAISQNIVTSTTGQLAAHWFPFHQLSTAISLGLISIQLGILSSFLFPPMIVKNHKSLDDIGNDLLYLVKAINIFTAISFLLMLILFQHEPKLPPSKMRALQKISQAKRGDKFIKTTKRLLKNRNFVIHCNVYSLNITLIIAIVTLLNPIILKYFQNAEEDAGRIGLCFMAFGLISNFAIGIILDKINDTHKYKKAAMITCFFKFLFFVLFIIFISLRMKWMVYVSISLLGIFAFGYTMLANEICIEYTYPESETITIGIMNATAHIYNITTITIIGILLKTYNSKPVFIGIAVFSLLGFIFTVLMKNEYRRQDAKKMSQPEGFLRIIEKDNINDVPEN